MGYFEQLIQQNVIELEKKKLAMGWVAKSIEELKICDLNDVKGLGALSIEKLKEAWITTKEMLKSNIEEVRKVISSPITLKQIEVFINSK